jgi:hypothetical protein
MPSPILRGWSLADDARLGKTVEVWRILKRLDIIR